MDKDTFKNFQLSEFEHIANAHFETVKQISDFVRYYLLIASAPSILLLLMGKEGIFSLDDLVSLHKEPFNSLIGYFLSVIAWIGFFVCWYIINLRHDALLYARTINGIRKYFYENGYDNSIFRELSFRVLPKKIFQPRYFEFHLFLPVIIVFMLINFWYFFASLFLLLKSNSSELSTALIYSSLFSLLHLVVYSYISYYRNNYYMHSHKIGIDIDGVLNDHRKHFCKVLKNVAHKDLDPEKITKIPLHEDESSGIREIDEHRVFNTVEYWEKMPPIQNHFREIDKIKSVLGYKIFVFSRRDWPVYGQIPLHEKAIYETQWKDKKIKQITKSWLKNNGIKYDQLILEKGNTDLSDTTFSILRRTFWTLRGKSILTKNRFQISKRKNFRFFVDDDPIIVNKLSDICDFVFVINQPYNLKEQFPPNVIRVDNWSDILKNIRLLS